MLALALALTASAAACRPKAAVEAPIATETAKSTETTEAVPLEDHAAVAPTEATCRVDAQCDTYLRCEDGTCQVPPAVDGRVVEGMPTATFTLDGAELATFYLEIADDDAERTRGLMYRRKMDPGFGMLFVFDAEAMRSFWMKNTLIPLDMVHINASGEVVGIVARAEPLTLTARRVGEPARYVLELTAGRAEEVGIVPGAKMSLTGLPADQLPR